VNFWHLVLGVVFGKSKCLREALLVGLEVNGSLNQTILNQELCSFLRAHVLSYFDCDFAELFLSTVCLGDS
jgi:hypothetical protein